MMAAVIPSIGIGGFNLSFSIDMNSMTGAIGSEGGTLPFWLSYGLSFLNGLEYVSADERFTVALNRTTPLLGDELGLFPGVVHEWDGVDEKLSLDIDYSGRMFSFRVFAEDLSFSDYDGPDPKIISGMRLEAVPFSAWPLSLNFSMMGRFSYGGAGNSGLFPSLHVDVPIIGLDPFILSLRIGYIHAISCADGIRDKNDHAFYFGIPFSYEDVMISIGAMVQGKEIRYNMFNQNFSSAGAGGVAFFLDSDISTRYFDISLNTFIDFDPETERFDLDNAYLDISLGFKLGNIDFLLGARRQGDPRNGFFKSSDYFIGIKTQTGSLKSELSFRVLDGRPQLGFSSSLALIDIDNINSTRGDGRFVDLKFDLGFDKKMGQRTYFILTPIIFFGGDTYNIAFRFPFNLELQKDGFALTSTKADGWWDIAKEINDLDDLFDSITDVFQLVEHINIGNDDSFFRLNADRSSIRNGIFFDNYRSFDALSLDAALNFHNMTLGAYVDDLEAPRIIDLSLGIYPFDSDGGGLLINAPTEVVAKDMDNYGITTFIGISWFQPLMERKLEFSFYAYSELSARYVDGIPTDIRIVYDFDNNRFFGYLLGAELEWHRSNMSIGLSGGINSGRLNPNTYNAFTSLNPDKEKPNTDVEGISAYLVADFSLDFDFIGLIVKYSMPNIVSVFRDFNSYAGDMFTIKFNYMIPNGVGISFQISRMDFISTLGTVFQFEEYFNSSNTIYSVSLLKEFDNMSLEATFGTGAIYEKGRYMNSYNLVEVAPMFKVKTRIGF